LSHLLPGDHLYFHIAAEHTRSLDPMLPVLALASLRPSHALYPSVETFSIFPSYRFGKPSRSMSSLLLAK
ncbi:MAG: hypothetical protein AAFN41_09865, partial [Planctomycetota bacterium]